jgi:glutaredoxin 2
MTRIYLYDHCPFCVRATMVAAYKQVPFERVVLLNDDEKTCHDLIGKKMVPILGVIVKSGVWASSRVPV